MRGSLKLALGFRVEVSNDPFSEKDSSSQLGLLPHSPLT